MTASRLTVYSHIIEPRSAIRSRPAIRALRVPRIAGWIVLASVVLLLGREEVRASGGIDLEESAGELSGALSDGRFASAIAPTGDIDRDGIGDFLVGAPGPDPNATVKGRVEVRFGPFPPSGNPVVLSASTTGTRFGAAVAPAGDVNGDGYADIIVGEPRYGAIQLGSDEGRAHLYLGSANGISASAAWTFTGEKSGAELGSSVAGLGDVDGDGFDDVAVGAPGHDGGKGRVYVFRGGPNGVAASPARTITGVESGARLGAMVARAGDVDADGFRDLLMGAPFEDAGPNLPDAGRASIHRGGANGIASSASFTVRGDEAGAHLGASLAGAGDVDRDGYADVIIGAPGKDGGPNAPDAGRVQLHLGRTGGPSTVAAWSRSGSSSFGRLGESLAAAGDADGDGFADFLVGAPGEVGDANTIGRTYVYRGAVNAPDLAGATENENAWLGFAETVAGVGDIDGDGFSDFATGAPRANGGQGGEGALSLWRGRPVALLSTPSREWERETMNGATWVPTESGFIGDVDGDGRADLAISYARVENGVESGGRVSLFLGRARGPAGSPARTIGATPLGELFLAAPVISDAGDVDGDGRDDLLVGAVIEAATGGPARRVYLYRGGANALEAAPSWSFSGGPPEWQFGASVASAGDVNGDGYLDILVGAPGAPNPSGGVGKAVLFLGSALGLRSEPAWEIEAAPDDEGLGAVLGAAGDLDSDGFDDVVIAAPGASPSFADEGIVLVYFGSPAGLERTPRRRFEGGAALRRLGAALAGPIDADGDGYGDLVIGAPGLDGVASDGAIYFFRGGPNGLGGTPALTLTLAGSEAHVGRALASFGDVDGDGRDELLAGAPSFGGNVGGGALLVFRGSASGFELEPCAEIGSNEIGARLGTSASAGDVDGDGRSDALTLAEGAETVALHLAASAGIDLRPRQLRTSEAVRIARGGRSDSTSFRIELHARSAAGRVRARLEWQVAPVFSSLIASEVERAASATDTGAREGGASTILLRSTVGQLTSGRAYRHRVRAASDDPWAPWTPWFEPSLPSPSGALLRTPPLLEPPHELRAETSPGRVELSWANGSPYELITLVRDGDKIADLPGNAVFFTDGSPGGGVVEYLLLASANGTSAPLASVLARIPEVTMIAPGEERTATLDRLEPRRWFEVVVAEERPVVASLALTSAPNVPSDAVALRARAGEPPHGAESDTDAFVENGSARLALERSAGMPLYLLVEAFAFEGEDAPFVLRVDDSPIAIERVVPERGAIGPDLRLVVEGAGLRGSTFQLEPRNGGSALDPVSTEALDSRRVLATFETASSEESSYDLVVRRGADNSRVDDAVALAHPELPGVVSVRLTGPEHYRFRRQALLFLSVTNIGDADVAAPLVEVRAAEPETELRLPADSLFAGPELIVPVEGRAADPGRLVPGERVEVPIVFRSEACEDLCEIGVIASLRDPSDRTWVPVSSWDAILVNALDPNDKGGCILPVDPEPIGRETASEGILFTVRFENIASAPAQAVEIRDSLPVDVLDLGTFRLTEVVLDEMQTDSLRVSEGTSGGTAFRYSASATIDGSREVRSDGGAAGLETEPLEVAIDAGLYGGEIIWNLRSRTTDDVLGFLAPGARGHVSFSIVPRLELLADDEDDVIENQASIRFDENDAIPTNVARIVLLAERPPEPPRWPYPESGAVLRLGAASGTFLQWDRTARAESWDVRVWRAGALEPVAPTRGGLERPAVAISSLESGADYRWRATARNRFGAAAGPIWSFRTQSFADSFVRGDANTDGTTDLSDSVSVLLFLFADTVELPCRDAADADDSGRIDLTDAIAILDRLFRGGPPLPAPSESCGIDTTPDVLDCEQFDRCE